MCAAEGNSEHTLVVTWNTLARDINRHRGDNIGDMIESVQICY